MFTSTNFKNWKDSVMFTMGSMDLDVALLESKPEVTDKSTDAQRAALAKWERSNRLSLLIMSNAISDTIRGTIEEKDNAKAYLEELSNKYVGSEKVETGTILRNLVNLKYSGKGGVHDHIMEMINMSTRLRALKIPMPADMLVHFILNSLPSQFEIMIVSYNNQPEKWGVNQLLTCAIEEEERIKRGKVESAHMAVSGGEQKRARRGDKKRKRNNKGGSTPNAKERDPDGC